MNILITGITGFVGSHLARYCLQVPGVRVFGTVLSHHSGNELDRIRDIAGQLELIECNLTNRLAVGRAIQKAKPDKVFHLAAQSFVPTSWQSPEDTLFTNVFGQLNLFEGLREFGITPPIVLACSTEEYGLVREDELPIKESNPLRPLSPYAVSKVAQEKLGFQYYHSYGTRAILTRFFNIEGPGRGQDFATSNFAKQVAEIEKGIHDPVLLVGNLEAKRDFIDVRDATRAYWLASEHCSPGEPYNVCSGISRPIRQVVETLLAKSKRQGIVVEQDAKRMRPSDVPVLQGDATKFRQATGWAPEVPFEKTMEDLLNYWRERV